MHPSPASAGAGCPGRGWSRVGRWNYPRTIDSRRRAACLLIISAFGPFVLDLPEGRGTRTRFSGSEACRMKAGSLSTVLPARAKLNVRLEVLGLTAGGLHEIRSLIADLGIADEIELFEAPGEFSVACEGADIPERENLVWLAATRLGVDLTGLHVRIRKRIPMQAGLGGGSADAAAALRALIERFARHATPVPVENIRNARRVGSDVAACMVPGFKIVEGTGDKVKPLSIPPPPWGVLLLRPVAGVPTSEAYRLIDAARGQTLPARTQVEVLELCRAIALRDFGRTCELLHNDFQPVIEM